jgi:phosphoenolpyruvate carboxykinase (ATP)
MINRERAIDYLNAREHSLCSGCFRRMGSQIPAQGKDHLHHEHTMLYSCKICSSCLRRKNWRILVSLIISSLQRRRLPCQPLYLQNDLQNQHRCNLERKEIVILGTEYAGEMKKGIFGVMNYLMPLQGVMPMHCSANVGEEGDVSILFGLSGTGKTTLSADPKRKLIGDDEHCWTDDGVFNIEGGCYAKAINLSADNEPDIYNAIRFGTVLENVVYDKKTREVDYTDVSITQNTRASYPIQYIDNIQMPCVAGHPKNIIFLTCDAFGVLPPVSKLTPEQASYHFIAGYTAKVAGTEMGVTEPQATFSACFGAAFMMWHPNKYAELLAKKMIDHNTNAWLVNTGWTGGAHGVGSRIKLKYTRAMIDAIHNNDFDNIEMMKDEEFGFEIPTSCPGVPEGVMLPRQTWDDKAAYDKTKGKLIGLFQKNFKQFEAQVNPEILDAGPKVTT